MNLHQAVERAIRINGETVTFRRVTGIQRVAFDVRCVASLKQSMSPQSRSSRMTLVGEIEQGFDAVMVTGKDLIARRFPIPPRHGDQVIFDKFVLTLQGRVAHVRAADDTGDVVYQCAVVG